jgi:hypothetical protein
MERNKLSYRELHGAIETLLRTHVHGDQAEMANGNYRIMIGARPGDYGYADHEAYGEAWNTLVRFALMMRGGG